jgi:hypothetical protein
MMIRKRLSNGPAVRVSRQGGDGKKATSLKTTLSCGVGRANRSSERGAEARAREILREIAGVSKRNDSKGQ